MGAGTLAFVALFEKPRKDLNTSWLLFSCWPVAVPTKTQRSSEVAEKLVDNIFSIYGCPISITSDQGRQFESKLLTDIMSLSKQELAHFTLKLTAK